jgi:hypothetical protein
MHGTNRRNLRHCSIRARRIVLFSRFCTVAQPQVINQRTGKWKATIVASHFNLTRFVAGRQALRRKALIGSAEAEDL